MYNRENVRDFMPCIGWFLFAPCGILSISFGLGLTYSPKISNECIHCYYGWIFTVNGFFCMAMTCILNSPLSMFTYSVYALLTLVLTIGGCIFIDRHPLGEEDAVSTMIFISILAVQMLTLVITFPLVWWVTRIVQTAETVVEIPVAVRVVFVEENAFPPPNATAVISADSY